MKYFINATVKDSVTGVTAQHFEYDVNVESPVTLETVKTEILKKVIVPSGYKLSNETFEVNGKKRELAFLLESRETAVFSATLEELPKEKKK